MMAATVTIGVEASVDIGALLTARNPWNAKAPDNLPAGLVWDHTTATVSGVPTGPEQVVEVTFYMNGDYGGSEAAGTVEFTVEAGASAEPVERDGTAVVGELVELDLPALFGIETPGDPVVDPVPAGLTHTGGGVLVGRPTTEGTVVVELMDGATLVGTLTLLVLPEGSQATDDPWAVWDDLAASLAPRVAALVGAQGDEDVIELATAQLPLVSEYVRGYTRGRGFTDGAPAGPLQAVIVSATARLATNPEQVAVYTMGDYSERPAQLAGWTLAEIGVLHRFRVVSA